jgi:hypothetical protein
LFSADGGRARRSADRAAGSRIRAPTLCSTADHRTFVCIAVLRCRFNRSGSPIDLATDAGKVVVIEIGGVQPTKNVMQLALRLLVAFASSDITFSGRRRHNRVGN